jgi:hypothetical protein
MSERQDTLQQYVSDMLAVEQHIHQAIRRQEEDESVKKHPEAFALISQAEQTLDNHIAALESHLEALGGDAASPVKEAVAGVLGVAAGLIDQVRTQQVSKMLRDNYTDGPQPGGDQLPHAAHDGDDDGGPGDGRPGATAPEGLDADHHAHLAHHPRRGRPRSAGRRLHGGRVGGRRVGAHHADRVGPGARVLNGGQGRGLTASKWDWWEQAKTRQVAET